MNEFQWFFLLAPFAAVSSLAGFVVSVIRKPRKVIFLSHFLFCCFLILSGQLLELTSYDPDGILLFSRLTYSAIAFLPVFWFLFALELTNGRHKFFWVLALCLSLVPFATSVIAWTNPYYHLLWQSHFLRRMGNLNVNIVVRHGPWFWVHCAYSYGLFLAGFYLIVKEYFRHLRLYQNQAIWILVGAILPVLFNVIYVFRLFGPMDKDFSPLVLVVSGILFIVGVGRFSLDNLRPIPRHGLYEWLEDAIVILDPEERIVDLNRAARELFSANGSLFLGKPLSALFPVKEKNFPALADLSENFPVQWDQNGDILEGFLRARKLRRNRDEEAVGYSVIIHTPIRTATQTANRASASTVKFTRKERQVLDLVVRDLSNKEIAERLNVTESTVKSHVHSLLKKAGVAQRGDLVRALPEN